MTDSNFQSSLKRVLRHEGGYSNDKADPGGATMWGITHIDYDIYRRGKGLGPQSVRAMTITERDEIYRKKYWQGARCDDLPSGVDYVVFDGAVNSGVAQSAKWLQRALGVPADGHIGEVTIDAAHDAHVETLIHSMCDQRRKFLRSLRHYKSFKNGWERRVNEVERDGLQLSGGHEYRESAPVKAVDTGAKAKPSDVATPAITPEAATGASVGTTSAAGLVQQLQEQLAPYSDTLTIIKYVLIGCAVVSISIAAYVIIKSRKLKDV